MSEQKAKGKRQKAKGYTLALACCLSVLLTACSRPAPVAGPTLAGELALRAPVAIAAGQPITVVAERADAPDGLAVTLVAQGSYGPLVYRGAFRAGRAEFRIPAEDTRAAGLVTLTASAGPARGQAELRVDPGPPVDPVTPLVGPRTLVADGKHWGTLVAIPFDAFGNPVADGTAVEFRVQRPGAPVERVELSVRHLLAWQRLFSATRAGRTTVVAIAGAGTAHGPEASLEETPGWPATFALSASPPNVPADGRQLVTLRAGPIADSYGNPMLDGTLVTFVAEAPDGEPRLIPAYTIDGVAEAQLQAPTMPGAVTVRATLYGIESAPLRVVFTAGPAVGDIPLAATVDTAAGTVAIVAGPLLGAGGQFVPEGTPVRLSIIGPGGTAEQRVAVAAGGLAGLELPLADLAPGDYQVTVEVGSGVGQARFRVP